MRPKSHFDVPLRYSHRAGPTGLKRQRVHGSCLSGTTSRSSMLWATPPVTTHTHVVITHQALRILHGTHPVHPPHSHTPAPRSHGAPLFTDALIHDARTREDAPLFTPESRATHRRVASSNSLRATAHPTSQKPHSPRRCRHIFVSGHRKSVVDCGARRKSVVDCGAHHLHMLHMIKGPSTAPTTAPDGP